MFLFTEATLLAAAKRAGLRATKIFQYQRYPLANHLYWLACGKPGGQNIWPIFSEPTLRNAYDSVLIQQKTADTLIAIFEADGTIG